MSKIKRVVARQVYDSRGNPTIEAEVFSLNLSASAICPSGASTGTFEAYEKRDKTNKKYSYFRSVFEPSRGQSPTGVHDFLALQWCPLEADIFFKTVLESRSVKSLKCL